MTAALDKIRAEIDALDADLRLRLLRRAELVAEIGVAKADNGTQGSPLRPMREMQQMRSCLSTAPMRRCVRRLVLGIKYPSNHVHRARLMRFGASLKAKRIIFQK